MSRFDKSETLERHTAESIYEKIVLFLTINDKKTIITQATPQIFPSKPSTQNFPAFLLLTPIFLSLKRLVP
jgi:hypothetical protein